MKYSLVLASTLTLFPLCAQAEVTLEFKQRLAVAVCSDFANGTTMYSAAQLIAPAIIARDSQVAVAFDNGNDDLGGYLGKKHLDQIFLMAYGRCPQYFLPEEVEVLRDRIEQ